MVPSFIPRFYPISSSLANFADFLKTSLTELHFYRGVFLFALLGDLEAGGGGEG